MLPTITTAIASAGTVHDNNYFMDLIIQSVEYHPKTFTLLADSGYMSKDNYAFCEEAGIKPYIDFRSNVKARRAKSGIWKKQLNLWKNDKEAWKSVYSSRQLIEQIIGVIKKKNLNYLRSKTPIKQDVELLLKALVYNMTIIAKNI